MCIFHKCLPQYSETIAKLSIFLENLALRLKGGGALRAHTNFATVSLFNFRNLFSKIYEKRSNESDGEAVRLIFLQHR